LTAADVVAVDTSVAVPLLIASHEHHAQVAAWARGRTLCLSGHSLAETYAVVTRLPGGARVSAQDAARLIDENFAHPLVVSARAARLCHFGVATVFHLPDPPAARPNG
jgi:predicted nucleic acid-binding protein